MSMSVTDSAPSRAASAAASQPTFPAPMMTTFFADLGLIELAFPQKIEGGDGPFVARDGDLPRLPRPRGDDDDVVLFVQLPELLLGEGVLQVLVGDHLFHPFELVIHHLVGDPAGGDRLGDLSPEPLARIVDDRFMALHPELPGDREPRRAAADDGDLHAGGRRRRRDGRLQAGPAEERRIDRRKIGLLAGAVLHAEVGAQVAADRCRKGGVLEGKVHGFLHLPLADQLPPLLDGDPRRAVGLAGRKVFRVFPQGDEAAQIARRDHLDRCCGPGR